jgi:hypothetical protein
MDLFILCVAFFRYLRLLSIHIFYTPFFRGYAREFYKLINSQGNPGIHLDPI